MGKLFRNIISLSFLAAYVNLNYGCFIPNLLFERVIINQSVTDSTRSKHDDDDNDNNGSESSEGVSKAKELEYKKEE